MSWSFVTTYGEGACEFRLVIEGWPYQFVTDGFSYGTLADGRKRIRGLDISDTRLSEQGRLAEGLGDISGFNVRLVDVNGEMAKALTQSPSKRLWLKTAETSTSTSWATTDTGAISVGDVLHINTEAVRVQAVTSATVLGFSPAGTYRGIWDSEAQGHSVQFGERLLYPEITDVPIMMTGRRAFLYAHGPYAVGLTDVGTKIWSGRVLEEPRMDGPCAWTLNVGSPLELLDAPLAAVLDEPIKVKGIYYAFSAPCSVTFEEHSGASPTSSVARTYAINVCGYYETQEAFVAALNTALAASTLLQSVTAVSDGTEGWHLEMVAGATPYWINARCNNQIDGRLQPYVLWDVANDRSAGLTAVANTTYRFVWFDDDELTFDQAAAVSGARHMTQTPFVESSYPHAGFRAVPRACYASIDLAPGVAYGDSATYPNTYLYVDGAHLLAANDLIQISEQPDRSASNGGVYTVASIDSATGRLSVGYGSIGLTSVFLRAGTPGIAVIKNLGAGTLETFRSQIASEAVENGNTGAVPYLTARDLASWATVVAAAASGKPYLQTRQYTFRTSVNLRDVLTAELRLYGLFLHLDSSAKLAVRQLHRAASTEQHGGTLVTIDEDEDVVTSDGFGMIEANPDGVINQVEVATDFDPIEGKSVGPLLRFRSPMSIGRMKRVRVLDVAPLVACGRAPSMEEHLPLAENVFGWFGDRYHAVRFGVTFKHFNVLIGDTVQLTLRELAYKGGRMRDGSTYGVRSLVGTVVGRDWDLGAGKGELTVYLNVDAPVAGYAPSARITATFSGTTGTVTVTGTKYAQSGQSDAAWFQQGDRVDVYEWDNATPTSIEGSVTSVSGNNIGLSLASAWTPGTSTWNLRYADAAGVDASSTNEAHQFEFCFIANNTRVVTGSSPKVFA